MAKTLPSKEHSRTLVHKSSGGMGAGGGGGKRRPFVDYKINGPVSIES